MKYTHLRSEPGIDLTIAKIRFDHLINERNGARIKVTVMESPDCANVVALTPEREIILARQHRFGIQQPTLELPGGMIDAGEDPLEGIRRELREETGYTGSDWTHLGRLAANPVFQDSFIDHFVLIGAECTHPVQFDEAEDIEVVKVPLDEVWPMLRSGELMHPHSVTALYWARDYLK